MNENTFPAVRHVFVSPHPDDVALSCGGAIAKAVAQAEPALMLTVFGAPPVTPEHGVSATVRTVHEAWGLAGLDAAQVLEVRRREDEAAAAVLGAARHWLAYPEILYRRGASCSRDDLFGPISPSDVALSDRVAADLIALWAGTANAIVYLPLAIGGHIDHRLCHRLAAALTAAGIRVCFYEDLPYAANLSERTTRMDELGAGWSCRILDITEAFELRLRAIACYTSQLSAIFRNQDVRAVVSDFARDGTRYVERLWGC
jgi:LmbE family N-acetylglucosaminyl deacetylase